MIRLVFLLAGLALGAGLAVLLPRLSDTSREQLGAALDQLHRPADQAPFRPTDFMVEGCGISPDSLTPVALCARVFAGGKQFLFGAPVGAEQGLTGPVDGVFLTGLSVEETTGLLPLRQRSWRQGRENRLPLFGPSGTADLASQIDLALVTADAIDHVAIAGRLDFDSAGFAPRDIPLQGRWTTLVDTGDVQIDALSLIDQQGAVLARYRVSYGGKSVEISGCGPAPNTPAAPIDVLVRPAVDREAFRLLSAELRQKNARRLAGQIEQVAIRCESLEDARSDATDRNIDILAFARAHSGGLAVSLPVPLAGRDILHLPEGKRYLIGSAVREGS